MRSDLRCEDVRANVSARLDDELGTDERSAVDRHLAGCEACRSYAARIAEVRHTVRLQPAEPVPDLTARITRALDQAQARPRRFGRFGRTAAIAAAAAFLVFISTSIDVFDRTRDVATATEIVRRVRAAARDLSQYRAHFEIVEHGWHPKVPTRRFEADVWFAAPERLRLEIEDATDYPSASWPRNTVTLVASEDRWSIREPSFCPTASLPACSTGAGTEERTIVDRQPFDGHSALPTDIAVPLETLSDADSLEVIGSSEELHHVALSVQQATPLLAALQPGGSWRPFHPLDRAELWIDRETWFPQRFRITAGDSSDRELWAERVGIPPEEDGSVLLEVRAVDFDEPGDIPRETFRSRVTGAVSSGGFEPASGSFDDITPRYTAGLTPYRRGTAGRLALASYVDGMTWLKVAALPERGLAASFSAGAEIVRIGDGEGFYLPADALGGRRVDLYGPVDVRVESNLPRAEILEVAASLPVTGSVPRTITSPDGTELTRLDPSEARSDTPGWVPEGYRLVAAIRSLTSGGGSTTHLYYRRPETSFEGDGIRVVESRGMSTLPPSSEEFVNVKIDDTSGRWSFERSELEWIDGTTYRAVIVPGSDLATALQIAQSLR